MNETVETRLEDALDALDHIKRVCDGSRTQTRRIQWIKLRAESGITGDSSWQSVDLPSSSNNSLIVKNAKLKAEKAELLEALEDIHAEAKSEFAMYESSELGRQVAAAIAKAKS